MGNSSAVQPQQRPDPETGGVEQRRAHLHGMWTSVAASWAEHAEFVDARNAAVAARMLELTKPGPGDRVLELACGPGGVGLAAAERVLPGGEVVLSDVAVAMTSIAAARANALGLRNVSTRELDLEHIEQDDGSFDVVLCRDGLQFTLDPAAAVHEIRRVLRPGGRVAIAVWGSRERNPWLGVALDVVSAQLGVPMPPPGVPGPFDLGDPHTVARLLGDAGLFDVAHREVPVPLRTASFEDWWERSTALAGPLARRLALLTEESRRELRARAQEAAGPYRTEAGLEFPGVQLVAVGHRG